MPAFSRVTRTGDPPGTFCSQYQPKVLSCMMVSQGIMMCEITVHVATRFAGQRILPGPCPRRDIYYPGKAITESMTDYLQELYCAF